MRQLVPTHLLTRSHKHLSSDTQAKSKKQSRPVVNLTNILRAAILPIRVAGLVFPIFKLNSHIKSFGKYRYSELLLSAVLLFSGYSENVNPDNTMGYLSSYAKKLQTQKCMYRKASKNTCVQKGF